MTDRFSSGAIVIAAAQLDLNIALIRAVIAVEAAGSGFLPDGRPKILFEAHLFDRATKGRYRNSHPMISSRTWDRRLYRGGTMEWDRLQLARTLDPVAADRSTSWGAFQILGSNHLAAGHLSIASFVAAMHADHDAHLSAFCSFLQAHPKMLKALRSKDWQEFARRYNGTGFKANQYDTKLAAAFAQAVATAQAEPAPKARTKATQAALNLHQPGLLVDGFAGRVTAARLADFQREERLPVTQEADRQTQARLGVEVEALVKPVQAIAAGASTAATAIAPMLGMDWRLAAVLAVTGLLAAAGFLVYRWRLCHG